jgi:apolipoprotein D and lipocalin family protein
MSLSNFFSTSLAAWVVAASPSIHASPFDPLPVVAPVDLQRYAGTWYEQARLPNVFQRMCTGQVAATYAQQSDGRIGVINRCAQSDGSTTQAGGVARTVAVEGKPNAGRLQVSFVPSWLRWVGIGWGDYWVMQLDAQYQVSLVGTPDRKYLWVLSRDQKLDDARLRAALDFAKAAGFDVAAVVKTPATPAVSALP